MQDAQLDIVFAALSDTTRRGILARLVRGEATVSELAEPLPISQPAVSRHLKVLEHAGLITRSSRGTMRLSHLEAAPLRGAATWLAGYREFWRESHDRLDDLLRELKDHPSTEETP